MGCTIGVPDSMFAWFQKKNGSSDNLVIGMDNDLHSRPFDGMIDEVSWFLPRGDLPYHAPQNRLSFSLSTTFGTTSQ